VRPRWGRDGHSDHGHGDEAREPCEVVVCRGHPLRGARTRFQERNVCTPAAHRGSACHSALAALGPAAVPIPPDQSDIRDGMVRGATRAGRSDCRAVVGKRGYAVDAHGLDGLWVGHIRQHRRQPARPPRCPGVESLAHQHVLPLCPWICLRDELAQVQLWISEHPPVPPWSWRPCRRSDHDGKALIA
jgi:hypothetical protein